MIRELTKATAPQGSAPGHPDEHVYEIKSGNLTAIVSNLGASLRSLQFKGVELTLGHYDEKTYQSNTTYFATVVGRFGNRIAGGRYTLDGRAYTLATNNGPNHLHGGPKGYHTKYWKAEVVSRVFSLQGSGLGPASSTAEGLRFSLNSPDGDEGYGGELSAVTEVLIDEADRLYFSYHVSARAATPQNLTNHAYWNLNGEGSGSIHDQKLKLYSAGHLEVDSGSIPTGKLIPQQGGPYDFRNPRAIGEILSNRNLSGSDIPMSEVKGVDHNFIVDPAAPKLGLTLGGQSYSAVRRIADVEGRAGRMTVWTSMPGVQVYSGNFLRAIPGRKGPQQIHAGLCLETQRFPDAPNQGQSYRTIGKELGFSDAETASWDAVVRPGSDDRSVTIHRFE